MPVEVKRKDCTDSDGRKGDYVVEDEDGEVHGCHQRRTDAEQQRDAINASLDEG